MEIRLKPVGYVRTRASDEEVRNSFEGVEGEIVILEEYAEGLEGIDGFSHIIVLAYLHKVTEEQRRVLKVRFRKLLRFGFTPEELPEVGVFATDSPHRPNPIALTIVELVERRGNVLRVRGLDLFDGTPVLDIKPYTPGRRVEKVKVPEWYSRLRRAVEERLGVRIG